MLLASQINEPFLFITRTSVNVCHVLYIMERSSKVRKRTLNS